MSFSADIEQVNHLVQNITGLVKVVAALKNDSQSYLAVTIKGKTYQVDAGSWIEKGGVVCPAGTTRVDALCGEATYYIQKLINVESQV